VTVALNTNEFTGSNGPPADSPESLEQVRDILFGGQMRMVDARLHALEARLQQEQGAIRAEFTREVTDLDATLKQGVAQLTERLSEERTKRAEDLKALSTDVRELVKNLERRHQELEEAASQADAELRDHLLRQSTMQSAELSRTADRLTRQLEDAARELRTDKLDTSRLAASLTDLAHRLTSQDGGEAPERVSTE
jgi:chromosome segregation ATPase